MSPQRSRTIIHRPQAVMLMSEEQFVRWCDEDIKAEWIHGQVIVIPPATFEHDGVQGWLRNLLGMYVERKSLGIVLGPQFMIRLAKTRSLRVPDLLFIDKSRRHLIRPTHLEGPPDLILEIVSPDSESRDWREKYLEYQAAGVREYWVIDPMSKHVEAYALRRGKSYARIPEEKDTIASTVVRGWYLKPAWLWKAKRPSVLDILAELGVK